MFLFHYVLLCRPEDLRKPFGQFGTLKDVYLPKDYYTGWAYLSNLVIKYLGDEIKFWIIIFCIFILVFI